MILKDRFEAKFTKSEGCWEWNGSKNQGGYGRFSFVGQTQLSHRVAYQLYIGEIPKGLCVCHHCDNPGCVNPIHLFLGTKADNAHDRENKGRGLHTYGEKNGAKLTEAQVIEIRARRNKGTRGVDLAEEFGVTSSTISKIVHGKRWTKI